MRKLKNISFSYNSFDKNKWSTPKGITSSFESFGINVYEFICQKKEKFRFPSKSFIEKNFIDAHLIFHSGYSRDLEIKIQDFKNQNPKVLLIIELGDEPQTRNCNFLKASLADICLTPDADCAEYWNKKGINCKWWTHWADTSIFYDLKKKRNTFMGTTMGKRKYSFFLKILLGKNFINKFCIGEENTYFYNTLKIVFQYSKFNEITRRIFESSACGCCVITNRIPESKKLSSIFVHNESIIYFDNIFSLLIEILKIIFNPKKVKMISNNANFIVMQNHTQISRVKQLIGFIESDRKFIS